MGKQEEYVLGLDFGTGGCKACAITTNGLLAGTESESYPTYSPHQGWAEQNPKDWMPAIAKAIQKLLDKNGIAPQVIQAVALSTAAHIGVLLDEKNNIVRNAILWNDQRSHLEVEELNNSCGQIIWEKTLQKVSTTWTLPQLLWIKKNDPDSWTRKYRIAMSKDYIIWQLTGRMVTDSATAVSSLLYDVNKKGWSDKLCNLIGISSDSLPEILEPSEIAGKLTSQVAKHLGLSAGIPVVVGTLDSAAEMIGANIVHPGQVQLRLATAGGIHLVLKDVQQAQKGLEEGPTSEKNLSDECSVCSHNAHLIKYPHPIKPLWFCQAGTNSCASSISWAIQNFTAGKGMSFAKWDQAASHVSAGSDGLIYHPYLSGERCPHWDPFLRGSFTGASLQHTTAHFARSVYEGTALSIKDAMADLGSFYHSEEPIIAVGGGTESHVWMQIMADVLGTPIRVSKETDSSYGAALLGLAGLGLRDLKVKNENSVKLGAQKEFIPNTENEKTYNHQFLLYKKIHKALANIYHNK